MQTKTLTTPGPTLAPFSREAGNGGTQHLFRAEEAGSAADELPRASIPGDFVATRGNHGLRQFLANGCAALASLVLLCVACRSGAGELYLTSEGAGSRNGASWSDAFGRERLPSVINDLMQPGDRLWLGGGMYSGVECIISRGGEMGRTKEIVGVDRGEGLPVLVGKWSVEQPHKGATAFRIEAGVSHVALRGIRIRGYAYGVHAPSSLEKGARSHLRLEDVCMEQFRYGFFLADCDDTEFQRCELKRYTKHAFRLEQGCDRVTFKQCLADCSEGDATWETRTELFPFGFVVNDGGAPNTLILFEDCVARNHMMPLQTTKYKNGDGFVLEGNTTGVRLVRCRAIRNQDSGFDLKVRGVKLTHCVALGNPRGFRIWSTGELDNCFAGWGTVGLWMNGGPITAQRCTFHNLSDAAVLTDDAALSEVVLTDCLITATPTPYRNTARGKVTLTGTVSTAGTGEEASRQKHLDGSADSIDNSAYPDKGYDSKRAK